MAGDEAVAGEELLDAYLVRWRRQEGRVERPLAEERALVRQYLLDAWARQEVWRRTHTRRRIIRTWSMRRPGVEPPPGSYLWGREGMAEVILAGEIEEADVLAWAAALMSLMEVVLSPDTEDGPHPGDWPELPELAALTQLVERRLASGAVRCALPAVGVQLTCGLLPGSEVCGADEGAGPLVCYPSRAPQDAAATIEMTGVRFSNTKLVALGSLTLRECTLSRTTLCVLSDCLPRIHITDLRVDSDYFTIVAAREAMRHMAYELRLERVQAPGTRILVGGGVPAHADWIAGLVSEVRRHADTFEAPPFLGYVDAREVTCTDLRIFRACGEPVRLSRITASDSVTISTCHVRDTGTLPHAAHVTATDVRSFWLEATARGPADRFVGESLHVEHLQLSGWAHVALRRVDLERLAVLCSSVDGTARIEEASVFGELACGAPLLVYRGRAPQVIGVRGQTRAALLLLGGPCECVPELHVESPESLVVVVHTEGVSTPTLHLPRGSTRVILLAVEDAEALDGFLASWRTGRGPLQLVERFGLEDAHPSYSATWGLLRALWRLGGFPLP